MVREVYQVDDLVVDRGARTVFRGDQRIELPRLSFDLLLALIDASPDAVSVEDLMNTVWVGVVVSPATVSKRVELLRQALNDSAEQPRYVESVRSFGYCLATPVGRSERADPTREPPQETPGKRYPVWAAALLVGVLVGWVLWNELTTAPDPDTPVEPEDARSLAILPFRALGDDREEQWFAEGLSEELSHTLARSGELRVAGRISVEKALARSDGFEAVGELLDVASLLEGSVSHEGDRRRVRLRLVSTSDGLQRWSETFEMPRDNAFALQSHIAQAVTQRLIPERTVARSSRETIAKTDPETYALYLKAVSLSPYLTGIDLPQAQRFAEQAVARDPEFSLAWSQLSAIHLRRLFFDPSYSLTPDESAATIREGVDRALAIDPGDANAYATLAGLVWGVERDMQRAAELLEQSIRLDPYSLDKWSLARDFARSIGDLELARALGERVVERDPLCMQCRGFLAGILNCLDDPAAEERQWRIVLSDNPGGGWHWHLGLINLDRGEIEAAEQEFALLSNPHIRLAGRLLIAHARGTWSPDDEEAFYQLMNDPVRLPTALRPVVAARLGRHDLAMAGLISAVPSRFAFVQSFVCFPEFEALHSHPGWPDLMVSLGFNPDGSQATRLELPSMPDSAR